MRQAEMQVKGLNVTVSICRVVFRHLIIHSGDLREEVIGSSSGVLGVPRILRKGADCRAII